MAQRPVWRGHLRLALVSCPVALYSARHDRGSVRFNMINPATGNRVRMVSVDSGTDEEIARGDTVKGYEFTKGRFVIVTDDDMAKVKVESSSLLLIDKFVDAGSIDPIYYDASYFLAPDGRGADDVYAVVRAAIERTGRVALARVVIAGRERTVALRPIEHGLVAHTLNEQRDLHAPATLFDAARAATVDPAMVKLAVELVDRQTGSYDPADLEDRYETRLREMLDAKVRGETIEEAALPGRVTENVVDLMAVLKQSLGLSAASTGPARPAAGSRRKKAAADDARAQPGLKLPIAGGRARSAGRAEAPAKAAVPSAPKTATDRRKAS